MARRGILQALLVCSCSLFLLFHSADAILAAMSVDLGSQFVKIGLVKPGVPMEIVLNRESHRKTPAIVAIKGQERSFSDSAANVGQKFPDKAYRYLTDLAGKKLDNPVVEAYKKRFPYYTLDADENRGTVIFKDGDVSYSTEELLAMLLTDSKFVAEKFAEQPVKDVVVTVPPYFNQAERRAVAVAANIAGLNLLQLLNDNTAAGLNYGMFRRNLFNESATTVLIYDMGATKTTATIFEYQLVREKSGEKNPQMTTLGMGYDRTLGGLDMTLRLRDHLVNLFQQVNKSPKHVTEVPRGMAKLFKEAERLKMVLSANADHIAQIENVFDDQDFKHKVDRAEFEHMCSDIFMKVGNPIQDALKMAELDANQIDTVILMGGATRVPKVQDMLQAVLGGKELGKYLNTDEAVALGAVYQAAHLSKGFKVKKFTIKEANLFPIQVDFQKENSSAPEGSPKRMIHRTLFGMKNPFPMKKVMTFSKHTHDFEFAVNYGDLKHLSHDQLEQFGELNISRVDLRGMVDAMEGNSEEGSEFKGIKAHFRMDESGILVLDGAEAIFEKNKTKEEEEKESSTLSMIGKKLSGLFSGSEDSKEDEKVEDTTPPPPESEEVSDKEKDADLKGGEKDSSEEKKGEEEKPKEEKKEEEPKKEEGEKKEGEKKDDEKKSEGDTKKEEGKKEADKNETKKEEKPKTTVVKVALNLEQACMDVPNITDDALAASKKRMKEFAKLEKEKLDREKAQNDLESFVFDQKDKIDIGEYDKISTVEEREKIKEALKLASDWMDETAGPETKADDFEKELTKLKEATKDLFYKMEEYKERPKMEEGIKAMLNHSRFFLSSMKNLTEDLQIFTETEMNTLEKVINTTQKWWDDKVEEQAKLADHEMPAITMRNVAEKYSDLDREVKYLINKAKYAKPKTPKKAENATKTENATKDDAAPKDDKEPAKTEKDEKTEETPSEKTETGSEPSEEAKPPSIEPPEGFEGGKEEDSKGEKDKERGKHPPHEGL